jgi:hypothetical protein
MFEKIKKAKKVMLVNATGNDYIRVEICTGLIEKSELVLQGKKSTVTELCVRGGYKVHFYENENVIRLMCERVSDGKKVLEYETKKNDTIDMHSIIVQLERITGLYYDYYTTLWCEAWKNRGQKLVA